MTPVKRGLHSPRAGILVVEYDWVRKCEAGPSRAAGEGHRVHTQVFGLDPEGSGSPEDPTPQPALEMDCSSSPMGGWVGRGHTAGTSGVAWLRVVAMGEMSTLGGVEMCVSCHLCNGVFP